MNYYPFHIGDYLTATKHLSWDEDLAYRRLIEIYYSTERPLPLEKKKIYASVSALALKHRVAVDAVLAEFFTLTDEGYMNGRCEEEITGVFSKRSKARASALLSVDARARKNKEIRALRIAEARAKGTHTRDEWEALVVVCGSKCVKCGAKGHVDKDHIKAVYQGGSDGIDNLQPLCAKCNAGKGPDSTDYRPGDWKENLQRLLSEGAANAERTLTAGLAPTPNPIKKDARANGKEGKVGTVIVLEGSPGWLAWKATGKRFSARDIREEGQAIKRGWYFPTEFPPQERTI